MKQVSFYEPEDNSYKISCMGIFLQVCMPDKRPSYFKINFNKMKKLYLFISGLLFITASAFSQVPSPAPAQSAPVMLKGGTIHTGTGELIENGILAFDKGKLTYIGKSEGFDRKGLTYSEIDVTGKSIYPGLIMTNSILGLTEVSSIKATNDFNETGSLNANVRSVIAYNTDSEIIPGSRSNGILYAQVVPSGGTIGGSSSVVQLDAWNWEDAIVRADDGIHIYWPEKYRGPDPSKGETQQQIDEKYTQTVRELEKLFQDGSAYKSVEKHEQINLRLEAIKPVLGGNSAVYLHVEKAEEIVKSIQLIEKFGIKKIVLVSTSDAYFVRDFIKSRQIPVVLRFIIRLPSRTDEDIALPYKIPALLMKEGIEVSLAVDGRFGGISDMLNLPFAAGTAAAYGLSREDALKMVTLNPAKMLGIHDRAGSLEIGKDASFVVSDGDLLDMKSNRVELAFISGRKIDLDNKHKRLYKKYSEKYSK